MPYLIWTIVIFLLLTGTSQAQSIRYRFWAGEIPPYSYVDHAQRPQGELYHVFQALVTRMGYPHQVEIVPWKRVLVESQKNVPIIFIPVARSPEREKLYHWIEPLLNESFGIFSLPSREREMQDKERIKTLRICTLRGSSTEELARRHDLRNLEIVATNDTCARLLKAGRVDAWLAAKRAAMASFVQVGYDARDLSAGLELEQWPLYLAASMSMPKAEVLRWRHEVQKMKNERSLERFLQ